MLEFGYQLGESLVGGATVFFYGDLGSGKTTLCRGVLQAWGHNTAVKSPTYTLVEPYRYSGTDIYHFDLYRLGDPEELEYIGIREYFDREAICLVEWPERGAGMLAEADLELVIGLKKSGRKLEVTASTPRGQNMLRQLASTGALSDDSSEI